MAALVWNGPDRHPSAAWTAEDFAPRGEARGTPKADRPSRCHGQRSSTGATWRAADATMTGTFNIRLDAQQWQSFTLHQYVVTHRPGFVWNAPIMLFPAFPVRVHVGYVAGTGILTRSILGLFSIKDVSGTGEPAQGGWRLCSSLDHRPVQSVQVQQPLDKPSSPWSLGPSPIGLEPVAPRRVTVPVARSA